MAMLIPTIGPSYWKPPSYAPVRATADMVSYVQEKRASAIMGRDVEPRKPLSVVLPPTNNQIGQAFTHGVAQAEKDSQEMFQFLHRKVRALEEEKTSLEYQSAQAAQELEAKEQHFNQRLDAIEQESGSKRCEMQKLKAELKKAQQEAELAKAQAGKIAKQLREAQRSAQPIVVEDPGRVAPQEAQQPAPAGPPKRHPGFQNVKPGFAARNAGLANALLRSALDHGQHAPPPRQVRHPGGLRKNRSEPVVAPETPRSPPRQSGSPGNSPPRVRQNWGALDTAKMAELPPLEAFRMLLKEKFGTLQEAYVSLSGGERASALTVERLETRLALVGIKLSDHPVVLDAMLEGSIDLYGVVGYFPGEPGMRETQHQWIHYVNGTYNTPSVLVRKPQWAGEQREPGAGRKWEKVKVGRIEEQSEGDPMKHSVRLKMAQEWLRQREPNARKRDAEQQHTTKLRIQRGIELLKEQRVELRHLKEQMHSCEPSKQEEAALGLRDGLGTRPKLSLNTQLEADSRHGSRYNSPKRSAPKSALFSPDMKAALSRRRASSSVRDPTPISAPC